MKSLLQLHFYSLSLSEFRSLRCVWGEEMMMMMMDIAHKYNHSGLDFHVHFLLSPKMGSRGACRAVVESAAAAAAEGQPIQLQQHFIIVHHYIPGCPSYIPPPIIFSNTMDKCLVN